MYVVRVEFHILVIGQAKYSDPEIEPVIFSIKSSKMLLKQNGIGVLGENCVLSIKQYVSLVNAEENHK